MLCGIGAITDKYIMHDLTAISKSILDNSIPNDDIFIHGFSRNIFRSVHPGESKIGGVCLYYRANFTYHTKT